MHERAKNVLPGGVTGAGRDTKPHSIYFRSGRGATLTDVDGNEYLEYHGGFGSAVLGYSHPEVTEAVAKATEEWGAFVGVPHEHELALAERLTEIVPCAEMVALCGGGGGPILSTTACASRGRPPAASRSSRSSPAITAGTTTSR